MFAMSGTCGYVTAGLDATVGGSWGASGIPPTNSQPTCKRGEPQKILC